MLRGHRGSVELIRGLFNPFFRRNLTAASIRYADEKDGRKSDGMFSWLKDMLKPDGRTDEARNAIDRRETILDYPRTDQTTLNNFKLEDTTGGNISTSGKSFTKPEPREPSTATIKNGTNFSCDLSTFSAELDKETNKTEYSYSSFLIGNINSKRNYQSAFLRHDLLTLKSPIRTIMGCTPRNTKPPIREPNMPEKQEKKDDKKEKKQKKPVIRMESDISENWESDTAANTEKKLHDNMDVNFRYQWGIRLPEEAGKDQQLESKRNWNESIRQMENPSCFVGDSNYSSYQVSSSYDTDAVQTMNNLKLSMSDTKDAEKKAEGETQLSSEEIIKSVEGSSSDVPKVEKEAESIESLKRILKTSPSVMKETSVVDEDYNVPNSVNLDAEISAWKDLVLKSKVPLDPSKEEFMGSGSSRRAEMLSIRPEPPQPKLDVQAVPTSTDEMMKDEEEEADFSRDFKGNLKSMDMKRTGNSSDVQKLDSKKLHTGSFCFSKKSSDHGNYFKKKLHEPWWTVESMDNDLNFVTLGFSTSTESGWEKFEHAPKGTGGVRQEQLQSDRREEMVNQEMERNNVSNVENLSSNETGLAREQQQRSVNFEQQDQTDTDPEFADSLNTIAERDIEISLSRSEEENARENSEPAQRDSRRFEADEHVRAQYDDFQGNFDYSNSQYEDDFYPGYESMSLEPTPERPSAEKNQQPQPPTTTTDEEQQTLDSKEMLIKDAEETESTNDYITDGNYVRIPGDPYPYSREHFNKWRLSQEHIHIGPTGYSEKEDMLNPPIGDPSNGRRIEVQQPVRKMSTRVRRTIVRR